MAVTQEEIEREIVYPADGERVDRRWTEGGLSVARRIAFDRL